MANNFGRRRQRRRVDVDLCATRALQSLRFRVVGWLPEYALCITWSIEIEHLDIDITLVATKPTKP